MYLNLLNERIFLAGRSGMVGNAIFKALRKYNPNFIKNGQLLIPSREELNLLNKKEVDDWFNKNKPTVVVIAAAKVGGIHANLTNPASFLLDNLKIQTNIIETSWDRKVKRLLFLGSSCIYPKYASQPIQEDSLLTGPLEKNK